MMRVIKVFKSTASVKLARTSKLLFNIDFRSYAAAGVITEKTIKTPAMGESITEGTLTQWLKSRYWMKFIALGLV